MKQLNCYDKSFVRMTLYNNYCFHKLLYTTRIKYEFLILLHRVEWIWGASNVEQKNTTFAESMVLNRKKV